MAPLLHLRPGTIFSRDFRVIRPLAEGGMGAVYIAEQLSTGHQRALKVMHPGLVADPKHRERFAQEARVGAQINSAHVVEVTAAGVDEETQTPWIAMELLSGSDLAGVINARSSLPWTEVHEIFEQLGDALGRAHAAGIVHRDLKPENIFIAESRMKGVPFVVKVLDFGISKIVAEHKTSATVTSAVGSPLWMAPEQTDRGARIKASTDVWPLGLIAFYVLTGRYYWESAKVPDDQFNLSALFVEIMVSGFDPATARARDRASMLPPGFDPWFARCVHRDPNARFRDASEALSALLPLLSNQVGQGCEVYTVPVAGASAHPLLSTRPSLSPSTEEWKLTAPSELPQGAYREAPRTPPVPGAVTTQSAMKTAGMLIFGMALAALGGALKSGTRRHVRPMTPAEIQSQLDEGNRIANSTGLIPVPYIPGALPPEPGPASVPRDAGAPLVTPRAALPHRPSPRAVLSHTSVSRAPTPRAQTLQVAAPPPAPPPVSVNAEVPEQPSRQSVALALRGLSPAVRACGFQGSVTATVTFVSSGGVSTVDVIGSQLAAGQGACVARVIHGATVPPFSRPFFRVTFPYQGAPGLD